MIWNGVIVRLELDKRFQQHMRPEDMSSETTFPTSQSVHGCEMCGDAAVETSERPRMNAKPKRIP